MPKTETLKRVLFLPDAHVPFHNKRAFKLIFQQVVPAFKWDTICILGDWFDFYELSRFVKNPARLRGLHNELRPGLKWLERIEQLPFRRRIFVEGNHERRLWTHVSEKAPEYYQLVLEWWSHHFQTDKWEYVPYMEDTAIGKLFVTHDVGRCGEHSTKQSLTDYQDNVVIGHNHLMDYAVRGSARGVPHVGASFGWLGDISKIDYRHRMKARRDWVPGFGVGYLRPSGLIHVQPVPIVKDSVVVEGRLLTL